MCEQAIFDKMYLKIGEECPTCLHRVYEPYTTSAPDKKVRK